MSSTIPTRSPRPSMGAPGAVPRRPGVPGAPGERGRTHLRLVDGLVDGLVDSPVDSPVDIPVDSGGAARAAAGAARSAAPAGPLARRPGTGETPLRLTRRGQAVLRLLIVVGLVALMTTTALVLARSAQAQAAPGAPVAYHVVLPGETLWGIASELTPGQDPRDTVALLVEINHLPSSGVQAGQRLVLPPGVARAR